MEKECGSERTVTSDHELAGETLGLRAGDLANFRSRSISIRPLAYGFHISVGCQEFAIESVDSLVKAIDAYLREPNTVERKWLKTGKLPPYEQELPF